MRDSIINNLNSSSVSIFDNGLFSKIIIPIIILVLGWFLKSLFDKYTLRPRLFLKLGQPLYQQDLTHNLSEYVLTWRFECSLKNNSKNDCYNITLHEFESKNQKILDFNYLKQKFPENNHLESNNGRDFEIRKQIRINSNILIDSEIDNLGRKIISPGIKIDRPDIRLKPKELNDITIIIKYNNEKGKSFYTKYTKKGDVEKNEFYLVKPFRWKQLI